MNKLKPFTQLTTALTGLVFFFLFASIEQIKPMSSSFFFFFFFLIIMLEIFNSSTTLFFAVCSFAVWSSSLANENKRETPAIRLTIQSNGMKFFKWFTQNRSFFDCHYVKLCSILDQISWFSCRTFWKYNFLFVVIILFLWFRRDEKGRLGVIKRKNLINSVFFFMRSISRAGNHREYHDSINFFRFAWIVFCVFVSLKETEEIEKQ